MGGCLLVTLGYNHFPMLSLKVSERKTSENPEELRKKGILPGVFYGKKNDSTPISIPMGDFKKVFEKAGESTVVTLKTENGDVDTLIHEVDLDPVSYLPRHVDFYVFDKNKKMEIEVPIEFIGEAPAVKSGLLLVKVMRDINVEASPTSIPHSIKVDVSRLEKDGDVIHIKDIATIDGVSFIDEPDEIVVAIQTPKEEKEEVPVDLSAIEVEKKGKEAAEGEEAATQSPQDEAKTE